MDVIFPIVLLLAAAGVIIWMFLRGEPAGHPHPRDRVGVLDVGLAERGLLLAHVLGADDVRGNRPGRGEPARVEQSGHVLGV